jgi:hypothetical protein
VVLSLLLGFLLTIGPLLDAGGLLGFGVENYAENVGVPWDSPRLYLDSLLNALVVFIVLTLLWRALDYLALRRAQRTTQPVKNPSEPGNSNKPSVSADQSNPSNSSVPIDQSDLSKPSVPVDQNNPVGPVKPVYFSNSNNFNESVSSDNSNPTSRGDLSNFTTPPEPAPLKLIKRRWFWLTVLALLVCWLPFWLGLWPGIFNYDAQYQYELLNYSSLDTHHPLLHTLLLNAAICLGQNLTNSVNFGVALYVGGQLLVLALVFALMLRTMAQEYAGKVLLGISFAFLALNPALVLWLLTTTKDVLFSALLLLLALLLYRSARSGAFSVDKNAIFSSNFMGVQESTQFSGSGEGQGITQPNDFMGEISAAPKRRFKLGFTLCLAVGLAVFAVAALRTSAVFSLVLFLPFALGLIPRYRRIRLFPWIAGAVLIFIAMYLSVVWALGIPAGPWQALDALSLPRQQLARTWVLTNAESDTQPDRMAFDQVFTPEELDILDEYQADNADSSRSAFRQPFEQNFCGLVNLYRTQGHLHPGIYADAALLSTYEAWYPGAIVDGYLYEANTADGAVSEHADTVVNGSLSGEQVELTVPVEPTVQTESAVSSESTEPTEPTAPAEAVEPVELEKSMESPESTQSWESTEPWGSEESTESGEPTGLEVSEEYGRSSYIDTSCEWPASEEWLLPTFGAWLTEFGKGNIAGDNLLVRLLCSPAAFMWLLLIALARTIITLNRRGVLVCMLLLSFGLAALFAPVVLMRYYLPLMLAAPLLVHVSYSVSQRSR